MSVALDQVYEQNEAKTATLHDMDMAEFAHDPAALRKVIEDKKAKMLKAAENLEFEEAAKLRDEINALEKQDLGL